uniref:Uncharacterized protein n=1 Tax=Parastrongyloides trichosuri TaxID=131310 RepID=A0A0N5A1Z8_PARTI
MIEALCVVLTFLVFYFLHQPQDSLGIVKLYREFVHLPCVPRCYHNCDDVNELATNNSMSKKNKRSSSDDKLILNTSGDMSEQQPIKESNVKEKPIVKEKPMPIIIEKSVVVEKPKEEIIKRVKSKEEKIEKSKPETTKSSTSKSTLKTAIDDSSKERSVYLQQTLRHHLK